MGFLNVFLSEAPSILHILLNVLARPARETWIDREEERIAAIEHPHSE